MTGRVNICGVCVCVGGCGVCVYVCVYMCVCVVCVCSVESKK